MPLLLRACAAGRTCRYTVPGGVAGPGRAGPGKQSGSDRERGSAMRQKLRERLGHWLWETEIRAQQPLMAWILRTGRVLHAVAHDARMGQINLQAMSLVYTTLLAIVPLLAFSFSVLKGFGVHQQLEPLLLRLFEPLGPRGVEVTENIIEFVDNISVGVLGSIGLVVLLYTVYNLLQKIENALNQVWHIRNVRSVIERFSNYISILLIGPVLIFAALGLTASMASHAVVERLTEMEPMGTLVVWFSTLIPFLLVVAAFTVIYILVPNTRVKLRAALTGAVLAGLAWQTAGWAFAQVIAASGRYAAVYSGFATLLFFIIWLYLSWLILLFGAKISFYIQFPQFVTRFPSSSGGGHREREELALAVMYLVGRNYLHGQPPWRFEDLCRRLHVRGDVLETVVERLEDRGLLLNLEGRSPGMIPARDLARVKLEDIVDAVRTIGSQRDPDARMNRLPVVQEVAQSMDGAMKQALGGKTLRDLVEAEETDD